MTKNRFFMLLCISSIVVLLDQGTKYLITRSLSYYQEVKVIPGFFNLVYVHNPGGAFGIFAKNHGNLQSLVFISIAIVAMALVFYLYRNTPSEYPVLSIGLALIFGGALGNMIDRIRLGMVIDFIDLHVSNLHWPAFNIADSAITIGMVIFGFYVVFRKVSL